ncbi:MAG: LysR family transcriptional regulator [Rhodospirillaceae bacterium]|nr:LysR family transcriptional regulator [Rhodospirillaceae bacterium]
MPNGPQGVKSMEFRQLRHFVAVVESGNLSQASRRVHISQPALTRSIKNLEDTLGSKLLVRMPRGVVPTATGSSFYRHALLILNECGQAAQDVKAMERGAVGSVAIGIGALFAADVVDRAVTRLAKKNPGLTFAISEGYFEDLLDMLRDGRIDLVFSNFPVATPSRDLTREPLLEVSAVIVGSAEHQLAARKKISAADLAQERWVIVNQPHAQEAFEQAFTARGVPPPVPVVRTNSLNLIKSLLLGHQFLAQLATNFISAELGRRSLVQLKSDLQPITRSAGLVYRSADHLRPAVRFVIEELRAVCGARATA